MSTIPTQRGKIPCNTAERLVAGSRPASSETLEHVEGEAVPEADGDVASNRQEDRQGHEGDLDREFGWFSSLSFAASVSACFATVCTTFRYPIRAAGPGGAMWCWITGGWGALALSFSVAELCSAYPNSGGIYYAASQLASEGWVPLICWTIGWFNLVGQVAGVASVEYGAAEILLSAISGLTDGRYRVQTSHLVGVMAAGMLITGLVNSTDTKRLSQITYSYVIFHGLVLSSCCFALFAVRGVERHDSAYAWFHFSGSSGWHPPGYAFLFGYLSVSWAMTDYDATSHISEEVKSPATLVPKAIMGAMTITYVAGFFFTATLVYVMGDPASILNSHLEQPVIQIFFNVLGPAGAAFFSFAAFIIMKMCGTTAMHALARTFWAFSREKMVPYHAWWTVMNDKSHTPLRAVWLSVACCIAINLVALASHVAIAAVFNLCVIALDLSYVMAILCKLFAAEGRWRKGPVHLGRCSPYVNVSGCCFTLLITSLFMQPVMLPVTASTMNYAPAFLLGLILWIVVLWVVWGKETFEPPKRRDEMVAGLVGVDLRDLEMLQVEETAAGDGRQGFASRAGAIARRLMFRRARVRKRGF